MSEAATSSAFAAAPALLSAETQARDAIVRAGRSLFERGYVHATAGNISYRLDDGFLITPTDACLGFLDGANLARLDADGRQLSGDRASKTLVLHRTIYDAARAFDPDTRCVIHTHSTHCVALSLRAPLGPARAAEDQAVSAGLAVDRALSASLVVHGEAETATSPAAELLPPITPYFVMKVGHVPLIPYHRPGDPAAAALVALQICAYGQAGTPIRAVMLQRLGPNVWHDSVQAAMATLEELEETARLQMLAGSPQVNNPLVSNPHAGNAIEPLSDAQIDELRRSFGARW